MASRPRSSRAPRDREAQERRRLEVLYDVTRRLAAVQESEQILDYIVNAATTLLGVEAAGLRLRDGDELVVKARTESAAQVMARPRLHVGESLSGQVFASGQPLAVEDLVEDTRYDARHKRAAVELGFHGFLAVPLRAHERVLGVLNVYTKRRRRFHADEIALLATFADQASLAIEKDRMLQEARDHAVRLQALTRLNQAVSSSLDIGEVLRVIAQAATELTGAPAVSFWIADEARRELHLRVMTNGRSTDDFPVRRLRFDQGIAGWVAAHGRAVEVADVARDPRTLATEWLAAHGLSSIYATPIVFHASLLGVLVLYGTAPFRLTGDDREVLDAFVTQAGVAIRNARLYDEVRVSEERLAQRSRELDLLNRMGELLQACVTEDEAYAVVGRFVGQFFPNDTGAVFVTTSSRNMVEARAVWGAPASPDWAVFKPEECWALRRGRMHVVEATTEGLLCSHLPTPAPAAYLCIPLIAQGESLGLLYLGSRDGDERRPESQQRLAATVADQLGLAVANLKLRETLRNQSIRDPLTGLFNRRYLEETLERELRRADRSQGSLGVVMLDLDKFKQFNDTFGHDVGDMLLRELGRLLQGVIRGGDVACRYGGEEFVLILPGADVETTRQRAERLRESAKHLFISHRGQSIGSVTVSAGIAAYPTHGITAEAILQAADAALYRAKSDGRDRVVISA
ncbi:MAG: diguanylate cyclase [Candidatus Rokubacteria bacterium]|nr:diguanylate cyclase [Candidatus Rokubacteria bacterium]